jgi:threonine dehydrogenase-like Zn-dependent dehydrogenase
MPALVYRKSPVRYLAGRGVSATPVGSRLASNLTPLRLVSKPEPKLPGADWLRLRPTLSGICGSDLGMLTGRSSPYLFPVVSTPFVPGHEVVALTMDDADGLPAGSRVVVDPLLGCVARGLVPCPACADGQHGRCDRVTVGGLSAGLQTGFCADTGGGWSRTMTAHRSQLHVVPDQLEDRAALLVEPLACAVHSVRRVPVPPGASVLVVGAGTVGLLTLLALRALTQAGPVYVVAKHKHQRERAEALGATEVFEPGRVARALRRATGGSLEKPDIGAEFLLGGVDVAYECSGGTSGLDTALRMTRAGGTVLMSGMPSGSVDLTPLWFRELRLVGSYASADGPGHGSGGRGDFTEALDLVGDARLDGWVDAVYPLSRWRDAVTHAGSAGRLGTVKVAFDPSRD